jgi:hypothetical protein
MIISPSAISPYKIPNPQSSGGVPPTQGIGIWQIGSTFVIQ